MTYKQYRDAKQKEVNSLPLFFAFSKEQMARILKEKNCTEDDLLSVGIAGAFVHKDDAEKVKAYFNKKNELPELLKDREFFMGALEYEFWNHEFGYTYDPSDTLDALGIDENFIEENGLTEAYEEVKSKF